MNKRSLFLTYLYSESVYLECEEGTCLLSSVDGIERVATRAAELGMILLLDDMATRYEPAACNIGIIESGNVDVQRWFATKYKDKLYSVPILPPTAEYFDILMDLDYDLSDALRTCFFKLVEWIEDPVYIRKLLQWRDKDGVGLPLHMVGKFPKAWKDVMLYDWRLHMI
jgi:hypothetical protein